MKSTFRAFSLCQRIQRELDQTTEPKTRKRLKDINLGTYSVLKYIWFHYLNIFQNYSISNVNVNYIFTKWSLDLNF